MLSDWSEICPNPKIQFWLSEPKLCTDDQTDEHFFGRTALVFRAIVLTAHSKFDAKIHTSHQGLPLLLSPDRKPLPLVSLLQTNYQYIRQVMKGWMSLLKHSVMVEIELISSQPWLENSPPHVYLLISQSICDIFAVCLRIPSYKHASTQYFSRI